MKTGTAFKVRLPSKRLPKNTGVIADCSADLALIRTVPTTNGPLNKAIRNPETRCSVHDGLVTATTKIMTGRMHRNERSFRGQLRRLSIHLHSSAFHLRF